MVLKYVELLPGELGVLMKDCGISPGDKAPDLVRAGASLPQGARTTGAVLSHSGLAGFEAELRGFLEVLAAPGRVLEVRRASRRRKFDRGYACLPAGGSGRVTLAVEEAGAIRLLFFFEGAEALASWLMDGLELFPAPEVPLAAFPAMGKDSWLVIAGLCDLFLLAYPNADLNWKPGEPIRFTVEDLRQRFQEAEAGDDSWLGGFFSMTDETPAQPSRDDLEALLWMFCNERLLYPQDVEAEETVFVVSAKLTWALRCLAWWDRGFLIRESAGAARSLLIVQASALWRIVRDQSSAGPEIYDAEAVDGRMVKEALLRNLVGNPEDLAREEEAAAAEAPTARAAVIPPPPVPPKPAAAVPPTPAASQPPFCVQCGRPLPANARFCGSCGQRV